MYRNGDWRSGRDSNSRSGLPRIRHFQCRAPVRVLNSPSWPGKAVRSSLTRLHYPQVRNLRTAPARPIDFAGSSRTFRESRDAWLLDRWRLQLSAETRQSYRQSTDEFLAVLGPDRPVRSLTTDDLDRYLGALEGKARARGPLTPATKASRIARVRAWLNWAWHEADLVAPVGQRLRPPPLPVTSPRPLPPEQIRAMLGRVSPRYQALLLILLDTGLRLGDALRLRITDLRRSQDGQPFFEVAISKTHCGGHAPLSVTTERVLRRYLDREFPKLWAQAWGPRRCPEDSYLFFSTRDWGHPVKRRSVEKVFGRLKTLTGWTGKCSPQILRHTAGNHAAEMGLNEVRIAQYLGHRTLKMVKRYTGTVDVIRNFDAVSPANALGHIPTVKRRQRRPQLEK